MGMFAVTMQSIAMGFLMGSCDELRLVADDGAALLSSSRYSRAAIAVGASIARSAPSARVTPSLPHIVQTKRAWSLDGDAGSS
jgi:hypothetical protein